MKKAVALIGFVTLMFLASSAFAELSEKQKSAAAHISSQWRKWAQKHSVTEGAIAIFKNGELAASDGIGREPTTPAPIASMTKAITGICIQKLVKQGKFTFETPLNEILEEYSSDVTIAELLVQTSGYKKDATQNPKRYPGTDREYLEWVVDRQFRKAGKRQNVGAFQYNNANYAMLGLVIKTVSGKSYEQACGELVLKPAGIEDPKLNPDWRIMSSWGGWTLSAVDYGKFAIKYFANSKVDGENPFELPNVDLGGGAHYGMGYMFRKGRSGGHNFWHDGKWDAVHKGKHHKFGAFFVRLDSNWIIVTNHNISAINGEHSDLERHLYTPQKK